jgi:hypothetical protein
MLFPAPLSCHAVRTLKSVFERHHIVFRRLPDKIA